MEQKGKREVLGLLKYILTVDVYLTNVIVRKAEQFVPLKQLQIHHLALEISCHGIPWITSILAFIWILNNKYLYQMQVNLLIGLLLDIVIIAVLKAFTRRRRPAVNGDIFCIGPDKYSFPSGHASRAMYIVYFFLYLWPVSGVYVPPLLAWSVSVCITRLLMRRHHLLDVCVGVILGVLEGMFLGLIYLDSDTCANLVSWITDEKLEGPEYDV